jgi:hypothetical protein
LEVRMPKKVAGDEQLELLKTLVIVQLGLAGVSRHDIRAILGCDMNLVTKVARHLPKIKKASPSTGGKE